MDYEKEWQRLMRAKKIFCFLFGHKDGPLRYNDRAKTFKKNCVRCGKILVEGSWGSHDGL